MFSVAAIYVMIMEAGFALCAANLSILYGLFNMANGPQRIRQSIRSLLSIHKPYQGSAIGSKRYRERLGSEGSDQEIAIDSARSKRGEGNVELLPMRKDGGSRASGNVGGADNMV